LLVFWYLYGCVHQRTAPWRFFQLNSNYFNDKKGIFSKLEMDANVPPQWRLKQYPYDSEHIPEIFPVFLKPEWGQNSNGIIRIHDEVEYREAYQYVQEKSMSYIVQYAASGNEEFEIYYLRSPEENENCAVFSITRVTNNSTMRHPVNSIHSPETAYLDITSTFSRQEKLALWNYLKSIGNFRMARVCIKADSKEAVLQGVFQIVEINLFLPMPLVLLAGNIDERKKQKLIRQIMMVVARLVKIIPRNDPRKKIFFRKMKAHFRSVR